MRDNPDSSAWAQSCQTCAEAESCLFGRHIFVESQMKAAIKTKPRHLRTCVEIIDTVSFSNLQICLGHMVRRWGHNRVFLKTYMSPMASGVTISNPECSYLSFPHELWKAFENKQVREFPKTILAIHSDTCCDSGPRLAPLCDFSWSRTLRFFSLLVQEWNSILYCQGLWSEILPLATILERYFLNAHIYL